MSFINYMAREINCKIVLLRARVCGGEKRRICSTSTSAPNPDAKGKMISLATETERTLFFDFLPLSLGEIRRLQDSLPPCTTVPGQVVLRPPAASSSSRVSTA